MLSDTVLVAIITSVAVIAAGWGGQWWSARDRGLERRDARNEARLAERRADLRELAETLPDMVTVAKEVAWERLASLRPMPRSDPRAMRLTTVCGKTKTLRVKIGDEELDGLVRAAVSRASKLSDTVVSDLVAPDLDRDVDSASAAIDSALARITRLLQDSGMVSTGARAGKKQE